MRLIKMTGGLGNQMFIYAFYLRMKKRYPKVRIDLSDMVHYHVHHGYEMHRVFNLPHTEFCINQPLKKVIEFLFFKKIYERKQDPNSLRAFEKKYLWPLLYFKGFYQSERFFADIKDEVRKAFTFDSSKVNARSAELLRRLDADANAVSPAHPSGRLSATATLGHYRQCLSASLLSECYSRDEPQGGCTFVLCILRRYSLGEGEHPFAECRLHRLEQGRRKLAGHDADEPLSPPHHLQQYFQLVGSLVKSE